MLKAIKTSLVAASAAILLVPSLSSADSDFGKIYVECGLGGIIASAVNDKTANPLIAVVTNVTWDLGTTASTSHFSSKNTCANQRTVVASFINQSFEKLEKEIASGEGEYLDALASLVTEGKTSTSEYTSKLREDFAKVVASEEYTTLTHYEKAKKLYEIAI